MSYMRKSVVATALAAAVARDRPVPDVRPLLDVGADRTGCSCSTAGACGRRRLPPEVAVPEGDSARLLVRPEELTVGGAASDAPPGALRGRIADVDFAGPVGALTVEV